MKKILFTLLFLFATQFVYSQFFGGISDGHSNSRMSNVTCSITTINPFAGGISDGHSNSRMSNVTCSITTINPFAGGISDGHSNSRMSNVLPSVCISTPIELVDFTSECQGYLTSINWTTSSENNNNFFTLERIENNVITKSFTIKGSGNSSSIKSYNIIDDYESNFIKYYKLKQTDYNGNYKYYPTIKSNVCKYNDSHITISPNPSNGMFDVGYSSNIEEIINVQIFTINGVLIYETNKLKESINISLISNGVYFIKISSKSNVFIEKIIIEN